jgi:hypothetical protein
MKLVNSGEKLFPSHHLNDDSVVMVVRDEESWDLMFETFSQTGIVENNPEEYPCMAIHDGIVDAIELDEMGYSTVHKIHKIKFLYMKYWSFFFHINHPSMLK